MKMNVKYLIGISVLYLFISSCSKDDSGNNSNTSMIIDHKCIDLSKIPESAIIEASTTLNIAFSPSWWHGTEIYYGIRELVGFKGALFAVDENGRNGRRKGAVLSSTCDKCP